MTFEDYGVSKMEKHKHGKFRWELGSVDGVGEGHVLDPEKMKGLEKPQGVTELPFERGYYEMFDFEDSAMYPNGTGYEW
ncbi:MAG: hypothetical protein FRX48_02046 [Lasallia pustulata]|uniref:Uncharacterized protein n=1 Tax=Lasallia pustulata TaxID=136370 RepID=A0A5M8PVK6_9LECA|nr:MAG: hypothetical protein FRX48_02046 [Lasallia pustulata]